MIKRKISLIKDIMLADLKKLNKIESNFKLGYWESECEILEIKGNQEIEALKNFLEQRDLQKFEDQFSNIIKETQKV